jgi:hypothetical protein
VKDRQAQAVKGWVGKHALSPGQQRQGAPARFRLWKTTRIMGENLAAMGKAANDQKI